MDGVPSYTIIQSFNITLLRTLFRVFKPFYKPNRVILLTDSFTDSRRREQILCGDEIFVTSFHPHTRSVYVCLCLSYVWRCLSRGPNVTSVSEYFCVSPVKCLCVFIDEWCLSTLDENVNVNVKRKT